MALDDKDKQDIGKLIADALKANNTELGKQFVSAEDVTKIVSQGITKGLEGLDDKVKEAVGKVKPAEGDGKKKTEGDGKTDPAVQARLDEMQARLDQEKQARETAEANSRQQRLDSAIRDSLSAAGVPADRQAHALAFLRTLKTDDGKPVLDVDDAGNAIWRDQRKGYVEALKVGEGVKTWSGTPDGKHYLPASGVGGTGDGAGGVGGSRGDGSVPKDSDGKTDFTAVGRRIGTALLGQIAE